MHLTFHENCLIIWLIFQEQVTRQKTQKEAFFNSLIMALGLSGGTGRGPGLSLCGPSHWAGRLIVDLGAGSKAFLRVTPTRAVLKPRSPGAPGQTW